MIRKLKDKILTLFTNYIDYSSKDVLLTIKTRSLEKTSVLYNNDSIV